MSTAVNTNVPRVYAAINAVQAAMAKEGISKDRRNQQQGYTFRGIDDVYGALAPHLAAQHLCILPRVLERDVQERETKSGGTLRYTVIKVAFDFVSVEDGSRHEVVTVGEAMDSGDKSTNKAMSAAYKYAAFLAFAIPTEGDNDADATTPPVTMKAATPAPTKDVPVKSTLSNEPVSAKTHKELMFLISTPKGAELWAKAAAKKKLTLEALDEGTATKFIAWAMKEAATASTPAKAA